MTATPPHAYVVLAAIELPEGSPGVISHALDLASAHPGATVHVLTVSSPAPVLGLPEPLPDTAERVDSDISRLVDFCRSQVDDFKRRRPDASVASVQAHSALGAAADEIVWFAAHLNADLVVVGTHGRTGLRRLLIGSVAERVARLCGCPVMVVRDKQHVAPWRVPEIQSACPDCAELRRSTDAGQLWCPQHAVRHLRAHVVAHGGDHAAGASVLESATGT